MQHICIGSYNYRKIIWRFQVARYPTTRSPIRPTRIQRDDSRAHKRKIDTNLSGVCWPRVGISWIKSADHYIHYYTYIHISFAVFLLLYYTSTLDRSHDQKFFLFSYFQHHALMLMPVTAVADADAADYHHHRAVEKIKKLIWWEGEF